MNHRPNDRTPDLLSSNQGKELKTRNLVTVPTNISSALTEEKICTKHEWGG